LGAAIRTFAVYEHLDSQGMATFLLEKDGVATIGPVVYQKGAEHGDQIYDLYIAATLSIIRELCGARCRPERVLFSHSKPTDAGPFRRAFQGPCQFNAERTALVFPTSVLGHELVGADPEQHDLSVGFPAAPVVGGAKIYGETSGRSGLEGRAKATADEIAEQLRMRFQDRGWIQ